MPTDQYPADLGSCGGSVTDADLWWNRPKWLQDRNAWPPNPVTTASEVTEAESKILCEVLAAVTVDQKQDEFDQLLERHDLRKALYVCAWEVRFMQNCRRDIPSIDGPITTAEIETRTTWWIRRVQTRAQNTPKVDSDKLQLNLQPDGEDILECRGRIQGRYPIYLPDDSVFNEKLVHHAHQCTLHGGLGLTMAEVREKYWIPRLRKLTKKVVKGCWRCQQFQQLCKLLLQQRDQAPSKS